jgi:hypothetical protein
MSNTLTFVRKLFFKDHSFSFFFSSCGVLGLDLDFYYFLNRTFCG